MLKSILKKLIDDYDDSRMDSKEPEDLRITYLKEYLKTPEMLVLNYNEEISFTKFSDYLIKKCGPKELPKLIFNDDYFTNTQCDFLVSPGKPTAKKMAEFKKPTYVLVNNKEIIYYRYGKEIKNIPIKTIPNLQDALKAAPKVWQEQHTKDFNLIKDIIINYHNNKPKTKSTRLFHAFLNAEPKKQDEKKPLTDHFSKADTRVVLSTVSRFFDEKSMAMLSATSWHFRSELRKTLYWREKLTAIGCDISLLVKPAKKEALAKSTPKPTEYLIQDFRNLYQTLENLFVSEQIKKFNKTWTLICLSGEPRAVQYGIEQKIITKDSKADGGYTPLDLTLFSGSADAAQLILNIPGITPDNGYAMLAAFTSGSIAAARLALSIPGINKLYKDASQKTAVHTAFIYGSLAMIELALHIPQINPIAIDKDGQNVLHIAFRYRPLPWVKRALQIIDHPWAATRNGKTILHLAFASGSVEKTKLALKTLNNDELERVDDNGCTPIYYAFQSNLFDIIRYALTLKQTQNDELNTSNKQKAVHLTFEFNSAAIIKLVLSCIPANELLAEDYYGKNAVHYAFQYGTPETVDLALQIPGIDPEKKDSRSFKRNALLYAMLNPHCSIVLVEKALAIPKIDKLVKDCYNWNVLHYAFFYYKHVPLEVIKFILEKIPEINILDITNIGSNILYYAAESGSIEKVIFLRQWLAAHKLMLDPHAINQFGNSAMSIAKTDAMKKALTLPVDKLDALLPKPVQVAKVDEKAGAAATFKK